MPWKFIEEVDGGLDASVKMVQIEELIRRVRVLIRLAEAKEHGVDTEQFLELDNDRNGSPLPLIERGLAKSLFQRGNSRLTPGLSIGVMAGSPPWRDFVVTCTVFGAIFLM